MAKPNLRIVEPFQAPGRPKPPADLLEPGLSEFRPAEDVRAWVFDTFIREGAPLRNDEHAHLEQATIRFLWASGPNRRRGKTVVGQAQFGEVVGSDAWKVGQREQQLRGWFGGIPDFLITLDALFVSICDDATLCALIEHELFHCAQAVDEFGAPRFSQTTGLPIWALAGHDVEQFVGVVRRYGADAAGVRELVDAANRGPQLEGPAIAAACGTCIK